VAKYELLILPSVRKDVWKIPKGDLQRLMEQISALEDEPRPVGSIKLSGAEYYRIRQGDYRIIYEIKDASLIIIVVRIGNRKDVYR
jgi:mRNA interferase RelE/StbE